MIDNIDYIKNAGLYFYRGYYDNFFGTQGILKKLKGKKDDQLKVANNKNEIFKKLTDLSAQKYFHVNECNTAELKVCYPGLYTGSGYTSGAGLNGEFQLGFLFDHTTGLPYLPGSSVKGAIRSIFPSKYDDIKKQESCIRFISDEILMHFIKSENYEAYCTSNLTENFNPKDVVGKIELEIFGGRNITLEQEREKKQPAKDRNGEKMKEEYLSVYERDIFYDAYVSKAVKDGYTKNKYLGLDYITPHKDNPLKNPVPLPFLKVLPGVNICFQFGPQEGYYLKKKGKEELFRIILTTFGIGAKTNVGYGQLSEI